MDNVFEELQKYIDKRVEEAVDAKIEELKAYLLNNIKPGEKLYTALEKNGFSERELRSAKEIACKIKTPLYKRVFEMYEPSLRPPSNTQFITIIEVYYYSSEASIEKTESH